jgi:hypothetical protein
MAASPASAMMNLLTSRPGFAIDPARMKQRAV